jgi:GT2 family glycosyltransferase
LDITNVRKEVEDKPAFSIIIVTKSLDNKHLQQMLDSTAVISRNFEILVIFVVKQDNVKDILQGKIDKISNLVRIRAVLLDADRGLTFGRNLGAVLADSSNLVFADDDVVLIGDISPLMAFLDNKVCQAVQPLIVRFSDPTVIDSAGDDIRRINGMYHARIKGSGRKLGTFSKSLFVEQIASARGAFMVMRKNALFAVGGFDSSFCFNMDDVDVGWRMTLAGFKILFVPTVKVLHHGGRTTKTSMVDRGIYRFWTVNYHALQLKVTSYFFWPLIIARFLLFSVVYQTKQRNVEYKMGVSESVKDFLLVYKMFAERFSYIVTHRRILAKFNYSGKRTFNALAHGQRFFAD